MIQHESSYVFLTFLKLIYKNHNRYTVFNLLIIKTMYLLWLINLLRKHSSDYHRKSYNAKIF